MSIEYKIILNKLTNPDTYSAQVLPRGTVSLEDLLQTISGSSTLAPSDVAGTVMNFIEQVRHELLKGNNVNINGLGIFGTSISAKLNSPTDELPADAHVNVTARASSEIMKEVRMNAKLERVESSNLAPNLLTFTALFGSVTPITAGAVYEIKGERLNFNPNNADEGIFFVNTANNTATRVINLINRGDKKLTFVTPSLTGTSFRLEVRARRPKTTILRTGAWSALLTA